MIGSSSSLLITEFYPRALLGDEYVSISSSISRAVNLHNWSVTDGEGALKFATDCWLGPQQTIVISFNSSSYEKTFGRTPDVCMDEPHSAAGILRSGTFRLADAGDSISLVDPSLNIIDAVFYGSETVAMGWTGNAVPAFRQGEVAKRIITATGWQDTGSAADWMPFREYKYGYTEFESRDVDVPAGMLSAFVSPDCSLDVVMDVLRQADDSIRLCSYQLSSAGVCAELISAKSRGVRVSVLVDGEPAGGIELREVQCLSALAEAGIVVKEINGNLTRKIVQHTGPMHSKYAVIDTRISMILSENFVEGGVPADKICGNRGWGLVVESAAIGSLLCGLFEEDSRASRPDVSKWEDDPRCVHPGILPEIILSNHSRSAILPLVTSAPSRVRVIVSPDGSVTTPFIVSELEKSQMIAIQQFQVGLTWEDRWHAAPSLSPLLGGVLSALRTGSQVRMIFDSSWFNAEGNKPALDFMSSAARNESLRGEFKLMDPRGPITVVHNKGAIMDGSRTLVSSNNWGFSSFARNREVAAVVDSREIATYFQLAFEMDWSSDDSPPTADVGKDIVTELGSIVELDGGNSSDDRVIAHFEWDLDDDSQIEFVGEHATFFCTEPGTHRVMLRIEDGWGNAAQDYLAITVVPATENRDWSELGVAEFAMLLLAGAFLGGVSGLLMARRRRPLRGRLIIRKKIAEK